MLGYYLKKLAGYVGLALSGFFGFVVFPEMGLDLLAILVMYPFVFVYALPWILLIGFGGLLSIYSFITILKYLMKA